MARPSFLLLPLLLVLSAGCVSVAQDTDTAFSPAVTSAFISGTTISQGEAFDQCGASTPHNMQIWWTASPYIATGIYIGGTNRTCNPQPFDGNAEWITQVTTQGWGLMPLWVGKQAPVLANGTNCSVCRNKAHGPCDDMDPDPTTAAQQGSIEADNAASAALALGLRQSVIYYDMEEYVSNASCSPAVRKFINAWTRELHTYGFTAGVYGEPSNAAADWTAAVISDPPDALWFHTIDELDSVWDKAHISNNLWADNQRIHQFCTDRTGEPCKKYGDSFDNVTFSIDGDVLDGPVVPGLVPDLREAGVSAAQASVVAGTSFQVTDTTLNQGRAVAGPSATRFYLSAQGSKGSGGELLGGARVVPALGTNASSSGTVTVAVPAATPSGTYYLIACADDTQLIKESNEGNNCRAASGTVMVSNLSYVAFTQGDPGVPGDGILVTIPAYGEANLTVPYPLTGVTDGITISIFSPDINFPIPYNGNATVEYISAYASPSCNVAFEDGTGSVVAAINVNGSSGIVEDITQDAVTSLISASESQAPGCTFTLGDISIVGFGFFSAPGQVASVRIDAWQALPAPSFDNHYGMAGKDRGRAV
jgi:hypothetical protein